MRNLYTALAAIVVTGIGATAVNIAPAQAASVVFDFTGNQAPGSSFTFPSAPPSDLSVIVTALEGTAPVNVDPTLNGLGVAGASLPGQIDGSGVDEFLVLNFSRTVTLKSGTFSNIQGNDQFALLVDGIFVLSNEDFAGTGNGVSFDFSSLAGLTGREFQFTASQVAGSGNDNDDYQLSTLTVHPVPEPSAILGSVACGMFGVAFARKRKRAHQ